MVPLLTLRRHPFCMSLGNIHHRSNSSKMFRDIEGSPDDRRILDGPGSAQDACIIRGCLEYVMRDIDDDRSNLHRRDKIR